MARFRDIAAISHSKTNIKCNFWKPRRKRLKGSLIFKVIQSTEHWTWLMFSHKYYGKHGFLFNEGWTNLADCLASACCWMYFKRGFKPLDVRTALPTNGTISVKKTMSCRRQLLGDGTPQTQVWLPASFTLSSCASFKSVRSPIHSSSTCSMATRMPVQIGFIWLWAAPANYLQKPHGHEQHISREAHVCKG